MRVFLIAAALTLVASGTQAESFKRITTEADYVRLVAGKTFCNEGGCWKATKSGKMTGKFGDARFRASWKWHKGYNCRAGKLGARDIPTDCQVVEVRGDEVRITRKQGKGKKVVYTRK